jgi:hypothetical protein
MNDYRVEVTYWVRSRDGDDWILEKYWVHFDTFEKAMNHAEFPNRNVKHIIDVTVIHNKQKVFYKDLMDEDALLKKVSVI